MTNPLPALSSLRKALSARRGRSRLEARLALPLTLVPWLAAALAVGLSASSPDLARTYALYPLLVSVAVLGLPHGALDHLVPLRAGLTWARRPVRLGLYLFCYAALVGLYLGLWFAAPQVAFVGFLAATVLHWGQGDQRFLEIFLGRRRPTRWGAWVTVVVRGGLPIVVPVLAFPETVASFYHHAALGLGLTPLATSPTTPGFTLIVLVGVALVAYAVNAVRAAPNAAVLAVDLLEVGLLTALFTLVPAYLAIGVYFTLWHSLRHLARLLTFSAGARPPIGEKLLAQVGRLALELLPITLLALALLGGLYLLSAARVATLEGFIALYLVLISALTVPHALVVALMDVWVLPEAEIRTDAEPDRKLGK